MLIFNGGGGILSAKILISSKFPLVILTFSFGVSDFLGNGPIVLDNRILVLDLLRPDNSRISLSFNNSSKS